MSEVPPFMKSIDRLEFGGAGDRPAAITLDGVRINLDDPRRMHYQDVLLALYFAHAPGTPTGIPCWQRDLIFDRWRAAWDLPELNNARRLAYLVDHYQAAITSDLARFTNLDLGDLWRARRWSTLLDVLDRLPSYSYYSSAISMDEEHAQMMAEAIAEREASGEQSEDTGPSLTTWTPEVAAITDVADAVRGVQHILMLVNSEKGKAPEAPEPAPRPITPLEKALKRQKYNRRKAAHEALVARVLPQREPVKSPSQDPVH